MNYATIGSFKDKLDNMASGVLLAATFCAILGTMVSVPDALSNQPAMANETLNTIVVTAERMPVAQMETIVVTAPR